MSEIVPPQDHETSFSDTPSESSLHKNQESSSIDEQVAQMNQQYQNHLNISTNGLGWALYAQRHFDPGDLVMRSRALSVSTVRDAHSVQTGWDQHVTIDLPARFINHSCEANVGIVDNDLGAFDFFALKEIELEEEFLWDYTSSEWEISAFSKCLCRSSHCRQELKGFKVDGESVRQRYGQYYARYLKNLDLNVEKNGF